MHPTVSFFIAAFQFSPTRVTVILVLTGSWGLGSAGGGWYGARSFLLSMELLLPCPGLLSFRVNRGFFLKEREFRCDPPAVVSVHSPAMMRELDSESWFSFTGSDENTSISK